MTRQVDGESKIPEPEIDDPFNKIAISLTGPQKAAAILVAIGRPDAARLLKHFNSEDLRKLAGHARTLEAIAPHNFDQLVLEFEDAFAEGAPVSEAGERFEGLLRETLPQEEVEAVYTDREPQNSDDEDIWRQLNAISPEKLADYLTRQNSQVAAYIVSKLSSDASGQLLLAVPASDRKEIVQRLLHIGNVPDVANEMLEGVLRHELLNQVETDSNASRYDELAGIINRLDKDAMDLFLHSLDGLNEADLRAIKSKLFSFEDIERLSQIARIKLFDTLPTDQITVALNGAPERLKELILASLSQRGRRMVEAELSSGAGNLSMDAIIETRRNIAQIALTLAKQGVITLQPENETPA